MKQHKNNGFTIVELIVVIVVIGILALVTMTVFGGVKRRAEVAKIDSSVRYIMKVLQAHKEQNGHFPYGTTTDGATCLSQEDCVIFSDSVAVDTELETQFSTLMGNYQNNIHGSTIPFTITDPGGDFSGEYSGIVYTYLDSYDTNVTSSNSLRMVTIMYAAPDDSYICPGSSTYSVGYDQINNGLGYIGPFNDAIPLSSNVMVCLIRYFEAGRPM